MTEPQPSASTPEADASRQGEWKAKRVLNAAVRRILGPVKAPRWPTTIRALLGALAVAAIFWYFGTDVWHSILLGSVLTTMSLVLSTRRSVLDRGDTHWRGGEVRNRQGARNDVNELSWSLRTRYGRVGDGSLRRVQQLAAKRLATFGLDLRDPADRSAIEPMIGSRAYVVLTTHTRRPPSSRSLVHCLDVLDSLNSAPSRLMSNDPRRASAR